MGTPARLSSASLGYKPEQWTPLDTVTFAEVQSWSLGENLDIEITMADLQAKLGPERAASLLPVIPDRQADHCHAVRAEGRDAPAAATVARELRALFAPGPAAIHRQQQLGDRPGRSADGHALLANDPHLGVANPSIWYAMGLRATDGSLDVTGVTFTGAPGIIIGHNRDIAWGVTNLGPDTEDLFVETLDPAAHPGEYLFQGESRRPLRHHHRDDSGKPGSTRCRSPCVAPGMARLLRFRCRDDIQQPAALQWAALRPPARSRP